jgi:hypothetical protein
MRTTKETSASGAVLDAAHSIASVGPHRFRTRRSSMSMSSHLWGFLRRSGAAVLSVRIHAVIDSAARCWSDAIHTSVISGMRRLYSARPGNYSQALSRCTRGAHRSSVGVILRTVPIVTNGSVVAFTIRPLARHPTLLWHGVPLVIPVAVMLRNATMVANLDRHFLEALLHGLAANPLAMRHPVVLHLGCVRDAVAWMVFVQAESTGVDSGLGLLREKRDTE